MVTITFWLFSSSTAITWGCWSCTTQIHTKVYVVVNFERVHVDIYFIYMVGERNAEFSRWKKLKDSWRRGEGLLYKSIWKVNVWQVRTLDWTNKKLPLSFPKTLPVFLPGYLCWNPFTNYLLSRDKACCPVPTFHLAAAPLPHSLTSFIVQQACRAIHSQVPWQPAGSIRTLLIGSGACAHCS